MNVICITQSYRLPQHCYCYTTNETSWGMGLEIFKRLPLHSECRCWGWVIWCIQDHAHASLIVPICPKYGPKVSWWGGWWLIPMSVSCAYLASDAPCCLLLVHLFKMLHGSHGCSLIRHNTSSQQSSGHNNRGYLTANNRLVLTYTSFISHLCNRPL